MPPPNTVLRSPIGLARATNVLLGAAAATAVLALYAGVVRHRITGDLFAHSAAEINRSDDLYQLAGTLQLSAAAATAIVFIIWFHRVRSNADVFAQDACTMGRGWAIGGWCIPLGNLWIPFTIAREVWTASTQRAPDGSWREVSTRPIKSWWVTWVAALVILRIGTTMEDHAGSAEEFQRATDVLLAGDALMLAAALLAIRFVHRLTTMQHTKAVQGPLAVV
ncbi:DUF4328 domain-containing protein [Streptomyces crystallinus]|uniref:DUF4328 domain-containing protein n=1 Tax=Streptomyces crystallinus TaxID=68191 RepID=A0ABN1GRS6_9ACTN